MLSNRKPVNLVCVVHDEMVLPGDVQVVNKMIITIIMTMTIMMMLMMDRIVLMKQQMRFTSHKMG